MRDVSDPSVVDPALESRAVSFENPTGARGAGGAAADGRKGAPSRVFQPGERVVLADLEGPGVVRHLWFAVLPAPPERLRALRLEIFYDGRSEPSVSVPLLDFFCLAHGRLAPVTSALVSVHEGRGLNSTIPMPFAGALRLELENASPEPTIVYFQADYTLERNATEGRGLLHAAFRRENPTTLGADSVIAEGLHGPGRYLGCTIGIRVLDEGIWYGEGEVKIYLDGDRSLPTICGTGLEDYVGSAWGMRAHCAPYGGCPLDVRAPEATGNLSQPDFVSMYRWHVADPVMFETDLRVTLQQLGGVLFTPGQEDAMAAVEAAGRLAGEGWRTIGPGLSFGVVERVDDVCATGLVYCTEAQPVPRADMTCAVADVARLPYEPIDPLELVQPPE